jgi:hypothetical protein
VKARHPNGNPEYDTWPYGYATANWWGGGEETVQGAGGDAVTVNFGSGGDSSAAPMRGFY